MIDIADPLIGLYWFAALLAIGVVLTIISKKIKVPDVLLLLLLGVIVGNVIDINLIEVIPSSILFVFSIFTLIMIVFVSSSEFKLKEVARLSPIAAKLSLLFLFFCIIFLTTAVHLLFFYGNWGWKDIFVSLMFATLMGDTSPDILLSLIQKSKNRLLEVLEFESIVNTPLTVIIPLVIIEIYSGIISSNFIIHFLQQIMTGVGTGLVLGIVIFQLNYRRFYTAIGPLIVIATILVTYALAEGINGNGILAITTLGIVYGRLGLKDKLDLGKFTNMFTNFLKIIVFILIGLLIKFPSDQDFLINSLILFLIYLVIRYISVSASFKNMPIKFKEKLFMSLNVPKGIAVSVVTFILLGLDIVAFNSIIPLIYLFILYSVILGSLATIFSSRLINLKDGSSEVLKKVRKDSSS
ncbi:MAG: cation:proton antiporter [Nanoarchaeota archaeon]